MMMTKNIYNAIVAEVEEMDILVMSNDVISKVKYVKVGDRKFRVSFWWDARLNESVVKVEEKRNIYEEVLVWDSAETDETFPDFFMNLIKESFKNEINARVDIFMSINESATEEDKKAFYERECKTIAKNCGYTVEEFMEMIEDEMLKDARFIVNTYIDNFQTVVYDEYKYPYPHYGCTADRYDEMVVEMKKGFEDILNNFKEVVGVFLNTYKEYEDIVDYPNEKNTAYDIVDDIDLSISFLIDYHNGKKDSSVLRNIIETYTKCDRYIMKEFLKNKKDYE